MLPEEHEHACKYDSFERDDDPGAPGHAARSRASLGPKGRVTRVSSVGSPEGTVRFAHLALVLSAKHDAYQTHIRRKIEATEAVSPGITVSLIRHHHTTVTTFGKDLPVGVSRHQISMAATRAAATNIKPSAVSATLKERRGAASRA